MASTKTNADIAQEADVVAAGELEGVKGSAQRTAVLRALPVAEDARVRRAAVRVRHSVFILHVGRFFASLSDTTTRESSVDALGKELFLFYSLLFLPTRPCDVALELHLSIFPVDVVRNE